MNCASSGSGSELGGRRGVGVGSIVGCGVGVMGVGVGSIVGCGVGDAGTGVAATAVAVGGGGVGDAGTGVAATAVAVGGGGVGDAGTGVAMLIAGVGVSGVGFGCGMGDSLQEKSANESAAYAISAYIGCRVIQRATPAIRACIAPPRICVNPRAISIIRFAFIYRIILNQSVNW